MNKSVFDHLHEQPHFLMSLPYRNPCIYHNARDGARTAKVAKFCCVTMEMTFRSIPVFGNKRNLNLAQRLHDENELAPITKC